MAFMDGNYLVMRAEMDRVVAFSARPRDRSPINGELMRSVEAHFEVPAGCQVSTLRSRRIGVAVAAGNLVANVLAGRDDGIPRFGTRTQDRANTRDLCIVVGVHEVADRLST